MRLEFNFEVTAVGSLPHTDPQEACALVLKYLDRIPAWPQLPRRAFSENMYAQFCTDFPGAVVEGERIYVDSAGREIDEMLKGFLEEQDPQRFPLPRENAAGLYAMLEQDLGSPYLLKGQVTGPISCGLGITDENRRPLLYHDVLAEALARHLRLKAAWQEGRLRQRLKETMIWVDEPYLSALGSAYVSIPPERVTGLLEETLSGIAGLRGIHCCGNTDWSLVLVLPIDVLSFDAYNYWDRLSLYGEAVREFVAKGKAVAWGIVPNDEASLSREDVSSLKDRLEEGMAALCRKGIPFKELAAQSLLTPSCGLASLSPEAAIRALELLKDLSGRLRRRYGG